ncbi:MAG: hypothetical protein MUO24_01925 [Desulfobacterales bacterium]|nr:hypothetical protein [Desulfobacterales bacterium]
MNEFMKKYYVKEEEFLDEFSEVAIEAAKILNDDWHPDYSCNDAIRKNREYFFSTNQLYSLIYDGAAVYHNQGRFSSVQIVLKSSTRVVTVRVKLENDHLIAEKIVDKKS